MAFGYIRVAYDVNVREREREREMRMREGEMANEKNVYLYCIYFIFSCFFQPFVVVTNQIRQNVVYMSFALCMIVQFVYGVFYSFPPLIRSSFSFTVAHVLLCLGVLCVQHKFDNMHGNGFSKQNRRRERMAYLLVIWNLLQFKCDLSFCICIVYVTRFNASDFFKLK